MKRRQPTSPQLDWGSRNRGHLVIERWLVSEAEPSRNADYALQGGGNLW